MQRGLISEADAEKMTPRQIYQLIWDPGLSTAEKVTEVSGRGMGMDIVKSKIEELNGTVDLDSESGRGTTLTIKLPLTLAILPSLMVQIDRGRLRHAAGSGGRNRPPPRPTCLPSTASGPPGCGSRVISMVRLGDVFAPAPAAASPPASAKRTPW